MRRSAAVIGSIAVHALVLVMLLATRQTDQPLVIAEPPPQVAITPIDVVPIRPTPIAATASGGGGGGGTIAHAPRRARAATLRTTSVSSYLGNVVMDRGTGTGADGGSGGRGGGIGSGIGLGAGSSIERGELPPPPPPPPAPVISKARPPILIFPRRSREVEDGEMFVARVKIDDEGYVVGARLVRGAGPHENLTASELIWRFRYLPALDDTGTPISWTLDQPFVVQ